MDLAPLPLVLASATDICSRRFGDGAHGVAYLTMAPRLTPVGFDR